MTRWFVMFESCKHWQIVEDPSPVQTIHPGVLRSCRPCALLLNLDEAIRPVAFVRPVTTA